jgi:Holliday junction resolvase
VPTAAAKSATGGGKSPYRLGRDFERSIRGRLERKGYFVMRAHGSKGKIDLLAVKTVGPIKGVNARWVVLGVQCKRRGDIGSAEWNELFELCSTYGIMPIVATKASERTVSYYRLDALRIPRKPGRPWTEVDHDGVPLPEQTTLV